jgi:hypothetical protein
VEAVTINRVGGNDVEESRITKSIRTTKLLIAAAEQIGDDLSSAQRGVGEVLREADEVLSNLQAEEAKRPLARYPGNLDEPIVTQCRICNGVTEQDDVLVVYVPDDTMAHENLEARAVAHFSCYTDEMLTVVGELPKKHVFKQVYLGIRTQAFLELEQKMRGVGDGVRNSVMNTFADIRHRLRQDGSIL